MRISIVGTAASGRLVPHARTRFPTRLHALYGENPESPPSGYLAIGLAHCYEKQEDGKLRDVYVIEPITPASLECMAAGEIASYSGCLVDRRDVGAKTSYMHVAGTTLGKALEKKLDELPDQFSEGLFCEEFERRCSFTARTWTRTHAVDNLMDIVPVDQIKSNFNYKTEPKRVLNFENIVTDEDNIKQDMSIDVYGRAEKEETAKKEESPPQDDEEEEDDLESFLAA